MGKIHVRELLSVFYSVALRVLGLVTLTMCGAVAYVFTYTVTALGTDVGTMGIVLGIALLAFPFLGIAMTLPNRTPDWLGKPTGGLLGLAYLLCTVPIAIGYMFVLKALVLFFQASGAYDRHLKVPDEDLAFFVFNIVAFWGLLGFVNSLLNRNISNVRMKNAPVPQTSGQKVDAQDLRSLRHSRMKR